MKTLWILGLVLCTMAVVSGQRRQQQPFNNNRFNNNNVNNRFNNNNGNNRLNSNNNGNNRQNSNNNNGNNRFNNNNNNNGNRFNPPPQVNNNRGNGNNNNRPNNNFDGFRPTPADARDARGNEIYPGCNGTVCLPVANLCSIRKQKIGHFNFDSKSYWASWASDEPALRNARWNWFTGRNYCRKMCMDMVSLESRAEENFVSGLMRSSNIQNIHTSGRLCDKEVEGCEAAHFKPLSINGWFWASTLKMMPPTNFVSNNAVFNNWAPGQPNGSIKPDGFGNEACMALIDNGSTEWHDEACSTRRHIVCEDLPAPNINFVRNQNPNINIP